MHKGLIKSEKPIKWMSRFSSEIFLCFPYTESYILNCKNSVNLIIGGQSQIKIMVKIPISVIFVFFIWFSPFKCKSNVEFVKLHSSATDFLWSVIWRDPVKLLFTHIYHIYYHIYSLHIYISKYNTELPHFQTDSFLYILQIHFYIFYYKTLIS